MPASGPSAAATDLEQLLEVWKVLETLTVSLRRLGEFELSYGEEQAKAALDEYVNPALSQRIARARRLIIEVMARHDPAIMDRLEELSVRDAGIGYWSGPSWMQNPPG